MGLRELVLEVLEKGAYYQIVKWNSAVQGTGADKSHPQRPTVI